MKNLFIILSGVLFITFSSCEEIKSGFEEVVKEEKPKNFICLVDLSGSIPAATTEWYGQTIKKELLANMGSRDILTTLPIDYGSLTASTELFKIDLNEYDFTNIYGSKFNKEENEHKRYLKFLDEEGYLMFEEAFSRAKETRTDFNKGTDILGALEQAVDYKMPEYDNYIIVFSDMIQETKALNLEGSYKSGTKLNDLIESGAINLEGFKLIVLTGEQPGMTIEKFNAIKAFWESFIPQQGGVLIDYNSGGLNKLRNQMEKAI